MKRMKFKLVIFIVVMASFLCLSSFKTKATHGYEIGEFNYGLDDDGTATLINYNIDESEFGDTLVIPAEITYKEKIYKVTAIAPTAFWAEAPDRLVKKIIISEGIEKIGAGAFSLFSHIEEVSIPSTVTEMGPGIFGDGGPVMNLIVSENNSVYKSVDNEIYSKDGKTLIQAHAEEEFGIYEVKDGVEIIGEEAFTGNYNIGKTILPASIKTIKTGAFFAMGNNIIGSEFGPMEIHIPKTVQIIEDGAFQYAWVSVTMDDGIKSITKGSFRDAGLEKLVMPDSITRIEDYAFTGAKLKDLTLSKNIIWIGKGTFGYPYPSIKIKLSGSDGKLKYINEVLYSKSGKTIVKAINPTSDYKIPSGVRYIRPYAFQGTEVKRIVIPKGVKVLSEGTFTSCKELTYLSLPTTLTTVEKNAWGKSALKILVMKSTKVPKIVGRQQKVALINVKNSCVAAYKKALKSKIAYTKIK